MADDVPLIIRDGERSRVQATVTHFEGRDFVDIRTYYLKDGAWLPTKKGIMLPHDRKTLRALGRAARAFMPAREKRKK